ncbi:hypothetical protein ARMSODRAFT_1026257 [Armillaria solidipes]|uniref:Uncharacterized protein n=1 Tax=Armillaria solidipes TaxID=1076256 RepID=A0A2H3AVR4_9AGAR|nr:hypothetical protein ARMSODRAFT_1026257 [Armillaria solidipes]
MEGMNGSLEQVRVNTLEHLRELDSAPSVGMHDTPKESLLEHLGFGKESDTQDAQLTRFVQVSDTVWSSSDEEPWDSDESKYFDVAHNQQSRRMFFQSRMVFDDTWQRVKLVGLGFGVTELMEREGGDGEDNWIEMDT